MTSLPQTHSGSRLRPYPRYKDSGVQWLGRIPEHWERDRVRYVFKCVNGATPKSGDSLYWDGDIPWLTPDDLGGNETSTISAAGRQITKCGYESCGTTLSPSGSLVLSTRAPIGHLAIATMEFCTNQGCRSLVFRRDDDPRYFYFLLLSGRRELQSWGQGSTFLELGTDKLKSIPIARPPLDEQHSIASFLDRETRKIDGLVKKMEGLIELLQEKRTALISHAVTQGLDPNAQKKDSGIDWLGDVPAHWTMTRVKFLARILRGQFTHRPRNDPAMYGGPYPFVQTGEITPSNRYVAEHQQTLSEAGFRISKQFPKGTLVMTITGAGVANVAVLGFEACFPDSIVGFVPAEDVAVDYLYYLFIAMREPLLQTTITNTQPNLNIERIGAIFTTHPPIGEQQQIAAFLDSETTKLDALMAKVRTAIERLQEYRTALISVAVTGQIDLREEAA